MSEKRMRADEYTEFRFVVAIDAVLGSILQGLERRLDIVENGKRDAALIRRKVAILYMGILQTLPPEQACKAAREHEFLTLRVDSGKLATMQKNDSWRSIPAEAASVLVEEASKQCNFCDKKLTDAQRCPLRKAMNAVLIHDDEPVDGCEYRIWSMFTSEGVRDEAGLGYKYNL